MRQQKQNSKEEQDAVMGVATVVVQNQVEAEEYSQVRYSVLRRILLIGFGAVLIVLGGSFGGLYVYLHGPSFLGLVPEGYGSASYSELLAAAREPQRTSVWFDRKRKHHNRKFAAVDKKFPAQYEIWEGEKLIERWHWRVEADPRTHMWADGIYRCVANYPRRDAKMIGWTTHRMDGYPKQQYNNPEPNSLAYTVELANGGLEIWALNSSGAPDGLKVKWELGEVISIDSVFEGRTVGKIQCGSNISAIWADEYGGRYNSEILIMVSTFPFLDQLMSGKCSQNASASFGLRTSR